MQNRIKALETVKMEIANVERIIDGIENEKKFPFGVCTPSRVHLPCYIARIS